MRNPIRRLIRRYHTWTATRRYVDQCRDDYYALLTETGALLDELVTTADHHDRWVLLSRLVGYQWDTAGACRAGWKRHRPDNDGRALPDVIRLAGMLLCAVADAEHAIAGPRDRTAPRGWTPDLELAGGPVLDAAIAAGSVDRKVLDELYAAVHPVVGRQAAEVIACLPVPGGRSDYKVAG